MCTRPRFLRSLVAVAITTVLLVGCSSGSSDSSSSTTTSEASSGTSTSTTSTQRTTEPPTTGTTQLTGPPDGSGLKFRPVLGSQPCSSVTPDGPDGPQSTETTVPAAGTPEVVPASDDILCYGLGPAAATGEDLARAVARVDDQTGQWAVLVTAKDDAKTKLNGLFDACHAGATTCPAGAGGAGSVAIELDGKVVSAPAIQAEGLASMPFEIPGSFTQQQAQTLAARLTG